MAWEDDLLDRSQIGQDVATYLKARDESRRRADVKDGYVFAIDAGYGEGKTFFLQNLRDQLAQHHPVAYIDSWSNDAAGQPLMALLDALDGALSEYFERDQALEKAGRLARGSLSIIGAAIKGAGKKAASKYLGDELGDEVAAIWADDRGVDAKDTAQFVEGAAEAAMDAAEEKIKALLERRSAKRLQEFRVAKKEIAVLKNNLRNLVLTLDRSLNVSPPIFILVDELDRCRPSYAIEFVEEVKHLFDVPGLVFVLAITGDQLVSSASHVYGAEFDSGAYFHRLIHNRYQMPRTSTFNFVKSSLAREPIDETAFGNAGIGVSIADALGYFADIKGLSLRESERLLDRARVASSLLSGTGKLQPLLLASRLADLEIRSSNYANRSVAKRIERQVGDGNVVNCHYRFGYVNREFSISMKSIVDEHSIVFNYEGDMQHSLNMNGSHEDLIREMMVRYHFSIPHSKNGLSIGKFYHELCNRLAPFAD